MTEHAMLPDDDDDPAGAPGGGGPQARADEPGFVAAARFEELRLRFIELADDRYLILANGPQQAAAVVAVHEPHARAERFRAALDGLYENGADPAKVRSELASIGHSLFGLLFPPAIRRAVERSRKLHPSGLRLAFDTSRAPRLGTLPFELIASPDDDPMHFSVLDPNCAVIRTAQSTTRLPAADEPFGSMPLLVVAPQPEDRPLEYADTEIKELVANRPGLVQADTESLRFLGRGVPDDVAAGTPPATWSALRDELQRLETAKVPFALLLIAHGRIGEEGGEVFLEDDDGSAVAIDHDTFSNTVGSYEALRLVVLGTCYGGAVERAPFAGLSPALTRRGVPAVISMQTTVRSAAAARFSPKFFEWLWRNEWLERCVAEARQAMTDAASLRQEAAVPMVAMSSSLTLAAPFKVYWKPNTVPANYQDPWREVSRVLGLRVPSTVTDLLAVARSHRVVRDWNEVKNKASGARDGASRAELVACDRLVDEAEIELAVDDAGDQLGRLAAEQASIDDELARVSRLPRALRDLVGDALRSEVLRRYVARALDRASAALDRDGPDLDEVERELREAQALLDRDAALKGSAEDLRRCELLGRTHEERALRAAARGDAEKARGSWVAAGVFFKRIGGTANEKRMAYAEGRAAEIVSDEQAVHHARLADCYRRAGDYRDAGARLGWVEALVAEADGAWRDVIESCSQALAGIHGEHDLRGQLEDLRRYAQARAADDDERWPDVVAALAADEPGAPCDARVAALRPDAELRLARARAMLAFVERRWDDVRTATRGLSSSDGAYPELASCVAALDDYALARFKFARESWTAAAAVFAGLAGSPWATTFPDAVALGAYAAGRDAEERLDWEQAEAAYAAVQQTPSLSLPQTCQDAEPRRRYAAGRASEERGEWREAEKEYGRCDRREAAERLHYVRLRKSVDEEDWDGARHHIEQAPAGISGLHQVKSYVEARASEGSGHWESAAAHFEHSGGLKDAAQRASYARARVHEMAGAWQAAIDAYTALPADLGDAARRAAILTELLERTPAAREVFCSALIADPVASANEADPYAVFDVPGICPASSLSEIQDAWTVVSRQGRSREARGVWDVLRRIETSDGAPGRLLVDATLLPGGKTDELWAVVDALAAAGEQRDVIAALETACPSEAALIRLLSGDREGACEAWRERLRGAPHDTTTAHRLAVASYWNARFDAPEAPAPSWRRIFGYWVRALGDAGYWEDWIGEREATYGHSFASGASVVLQRSLLGMLSETSRADLEAAGDPDLASLGVELEQAAAEALRGRGGLPGADGTALCAGPEFLAETGALERLSEWIAERAAEGSDGAVVDEGSLWLRAAFSRFAPAMIHHRGTRPEQALEALDRVALPSGEQESDVTDIAYAGFTEPAAVCLRDADRLGWRIRTEFARQLVLAGVNDDDRLRATWGAALDSAGRVGERAAACESVVELVLGRMEALDCRGVERGEKLEEAARLAAAAIDTVGPDDHGGRLRGRACEVHADLGVWIGSGRIRYQMVDQEKATEHLRYALQLNPDSLHAIDNLSRALTNTALNWTGPRPDALAFLGEAVDVLNTGMARTSDPPRLRRALEGTLEGIEDVILQGLTFDQLAVVTRAQHDLGPGFSWASVKDELPERSARILLAVAAVREEPLEQQRRAELATRLRPKGDE